MAKLLPNSTAIAVMDERLKNLDERLKNEQRLKDLKNEMEQRLKDLENEMEQRLKDQQITDEMLKNEKE